MPKVTQYVRVLPFGSDEWVAFLKFSSVIPAREARDMLMQSSRFKNVEVVPISILKKEGGVDAIITADLQIAGSWPITEQNSIRDNVGRRVPEQRDGVYQSIRWPMAASSYYLERKSDILQDTGLSFSSLVCVLLELWDIAPDSAKERARAKSVERGLKNRKGNTYGKRDHRDALLELPSDRDGGDSSQH